MKVREISAEERDKIEGRLRKNSTAKKGEKVLEIGSLFNRRHGGKGYAMEAAKSTKEYAFSTLGAKEVCSIIRDTNTPSMRVAIRNGMLPRDTSIKHYRDLDMLHIRFVAEKVL